jgi:26S proteasome regulatory subunit N2
MTAILQSSASGVLSLLNEPDEDIKVYALEQLNEMVDTFWSEIAHCIPDM